MSQDSIFDSISNLAQAVLASGNSIVVDGKKTIEICDANIRFSVDYVVDLNAIEVRANSIMNFKFREIYDSELEEYNRIANHLLSKFLLFDSDLNSRRVLWADSCCISFIHFLVRNNAILCFVHMRSSDCLKKLPVDLYLICSIIRELQLKLNIVDVNVSVAFDSLHIIID